MSHYPERIVCLTEETTETLYLLGQGHRIVGVSGYTVRPPEARQKPKVSAFINARFDKIEALRPDLVLAFSDLQADLAAELVRRGIAVVTFNQRSIAEILQMIRMLGGLVGCQTAAEQLADDLEAGLEQIRESPPRRRPRLRAFFEEWDDPLISGIRWVEELVTIAGGDPIFPELADAGLAKDRIVDPQEVVRRDPEIIFASWCGKKVNFDRIRKRTGWDAVTAVRCNRIHEIKSTYILQPGPAQPDGRVHSTARYQATEPTLGPADRRTSGAVPLGTVPAARGCLLEQQLDSLTAFRAKIDGEVVHIQGDVLVHHLLAHLLRVRAHEGKAGVGCANANSTLRLSMRSTRCLIVVAGSDRLATIPPSGIGAPVCCSQSSPRSRILCRPFAA